VVLLSMTFMYQVDVTIVNVASPSIRADLHASGAQLELVISGYLLASAMLLITGARLGYQRGYRPVFLTGLGIFGAASLACGLAPDTNLLIAARVLQGIGGALAFPQVLTSIQVHFDEGPGRTRALSLYSVALAGGAVAGQLLGGLLVSADLFGLQWRPAFLVNVPVTLAALIAGAWLLPNEGRIDSARRLDVPGSLTLSATVLLVVLPLTLGRDTGWPAWTWICLAASPLVFSAFLLVERRLTAKGGSPLVNLPVIRRPAISWGVITYVLAVSTYTALLFTLALYLQRGLSHSALFSGLIVLPWVTAFAVPGRGIGRLPMRLRQALPWIGCVILAAAYVFISISAYAGVRPGIPLLAMLALGGLGLGTAFNSILTHLTTEATPRYAADISGVFTTCMQIAGAIGVVAFGTLYLSHDTGQGAQSASHAFGLVTGAFALISMVAAVAAYRAIRSTSPLSVPRSRDDASMASGPGAATRQAGQGPRPDTALPSSLWPDPSDSRRSGHCRPHSRARTVDA
jgi:MFS family permease